MFMDILESLNFKLSKFMPTFFSYESGRLSFFQYDFVGIIYFVLDLLFLLEYFFINFVDDAYFTFKRYEIDSIMWWIRYNLHILWLWFWFDTRYIRYVSLLQRTKRLIYHYI